MSRPMMFGIGGVILGLILFIVSPWLALAVIALAIAVPVIAWRAYTLCLHDALPI